ncbi:prepilin-type processing-associated H-X9-DG domain-containing protein [Singulisphaera sp. GP187]|uniref:DUF1559 family PulG-like putative transporter n=1 Tax=Singulisphaera sp. GP187 TaxID=1882752 RepID=UPI00092C1D02|nr:DUF1559 domain-containing protein [Singulisphaera sp. GP187]SIO58083.1 prepilin-type processing-associated H-X9-DG domain-containing protein [Singulisphaera sp. GP187]
MRRSLKWGSLKWGSLGFLILLLLGCAGIAVPIDLIVSLAFGWLLFLKRSPEVQINGSGILSGVVCLTLFAVGLHHFLRWLHGQIQQGQGGDPPTSPWKWSWTTSLVAIIVLMFVAGLTSVGVAHQTGWLLTSSEPLLSFGIMRGERSQAVNNLKQMGLALYNYHHHEETAYYPPGGTFDSQGRAQHGWQALILAQMDNQVLYNQINFDLPWNDRSNSTSFGTTLEFYNNPGIHGFEKDSKGYALSHYSGNAWVLGGDKSRNSKDITDGGAQTLMAGEAPSHFKPWGHPTNWRDPAQGINRSLDGFGGPFPGGANFSFVDGSVRYLKNTIDPRIFKALGTPSGGEVISNDQY